MSNVPTRICLPSQTYPASAQRASHSLTTKAKEPMEVITIDDSSDSSDGESVPPAADAAPRRDGEDVLRFRRPARAASAGPGAAPASLFPPAVFTDARYSRGILVSAPAAAAPAAVRVPPDYFADGRAARAALSPEEASAWGHGIAAHAAAGRRFPMQVGRLLGTITLRFDERPVSCRWAASAGLVAESEVVGCRR